MESISDDQRDELELFDAMKKTEDEFKWRITETDLVSGVMSVCVDLLSASVLVSLDTSAYQVNGLMQRHSAANKHEPVAVTYLPPIKLHFQLTKKYPEKAPPTYSLCCTWLNFSKLSILCKRLDQIWAENEGCVILYNWQQFLQADSLQALGFTDSVCIDYQNPQLQLPDWDSRGIQEIDHPLHVIPSLVEYNESKAADEFKSNRFDCEICLLSELGSDCVRLRSCQHVHCKTCMGRHITSKIMEGMVNKLDCPASDCKELIPPDVVKSLVPLEFFKRYDDLLLQRTLDTMSDIVNCPRQSCMCATIKEDDSNMAVCPRCKFSFCCLCKRTWHGISPCRLLPDDLQELKTLYESGDSEIRLSLEQQYGQKHLLKAFEEVESKSWLKQFSKKCPNCKSSIEKSHGCNKMTCTCCNTNFCWLCEVLLPGHNPYAHFRFGGSGCAGKLFDGMIEVPED